MILVLYPVLSFSQLKITGQVLDVDGNPIELATIAIFSDQSTIVKGELTDETGHFSVEIDAGYYLIQITYLQNMLFQKEGYFLEDTELEIIRVESAIQLEGIEITASSRPKIKKELGKYTIQNPAISPFAKNKPVFEFLRFVPILSIDNQNNLNILNKGTPTLYINGRKIENNSMALNLLKSIPSEEIKTIEIITTPDSRFDASAKNGIINIITKKSENEGLRGAINSTISQSYFNSQNLNGYLSYSKNKITATSTLSLDNSKSYASSDYIYNNLADDLQTQMETNSVSKHKSISGNLNLNYELSKRQNIGIQFYTSLNDMANQYQTLNQYRSLNATQLDSIYNPKINSKSPDYLTSYKGNINYNIKTDNLGSNLDIELNLYENNSDIRTQNFFNQIINGNTIEVSRFLQNPDTKTSIGHYKADYTKVFNADNKLQIGTAYTHSNIYNNFFFGYFDGSNYVSDTQQSNIFQYRDAITASYLNFEKIFSEKWEAQLGLRVEHFKATGETLTNLEQLSIDNSYLFPSLSLLFIPNDDNEFSIDFGSYILRPGYGQLNPFIHYTSPNSFRINNPILKPILTYEVEFNYSFYENYMLNIGYEYSKDLFNEFDIILPDNWIMTTTANYGNSNAIFFNFIYSNRFFKNNWDFSATLDYSYEKANGSFQDVDMSFDNNRYRFKVKNQINLNKEKDFSLGLNYGYSSRSRFVAGEINGLHSLEVSVSKNFKDFNISVGVYELARADLKILEQKQDYNFNKLIKYYKTAYITLSYQFGNNKVKRVEEKTNSEINKRLL